MTKEYHEAPDVCWVCGGEFEVGEGEIVNIKMGRVEVGQVGFQWHANEDGPEQLAHFDCLLLALASDKRIQQA